MTPAFCSFVIAGLDPAIYHWVMRGDGNKYDLDPSPTPVSQKQLGMQR
jgi:hypothetical protein